MYKGKKEGHSLLKRRYFTAVGFSSMKIVADRHRHAAIVTSTGDELS